MGKTYIYHKEKYYQDLPRAYTVPAVGSWLLVQLGYREYSVAVELGSFVSTTAGVVKAEDLIPEVHNLFIVEATKNIVEEFDNLNNPNPPENFYLTGNSYSLSSNIVSISTAVPGTAVHRLISIATGLSDPYGGIGCICPALEPISCGKEIQATSIQTSTVNLP